MGSGIVVRRHCYGERTLNQGRGTVYLPPPPPFPSPLTHTINFWDRWWQATTNVFVVALACTMQSLGKTLRY